MIYLTGSLKNPRIPVLANKLRREGYEVFDEWYAPGPDADDYWQAYERARGTSYRDALKGFHARNIFEFDKRHLDRASCGVLVLPAGKSAHLELGYLIGSNKPAFILLPPDFNEDGDFRYDVMYAFATDVFYTEDELIGALGEQLQERLN